MSIEIKVVSSEVQNYIDTPYIQGEISIGNNFSAPLKVAVNLWSEKIYKKHWKQAIERIKTHDTSCLVTSIHNPIRSAPMLVRWAMYKHGEKVHIYLDVIVRQDYQETIGDQLVTPENCYDFIDPEPDLEPEDVRETMWIVDLESL